MVTGDIVISTTSMVVAIRCHVVGIASIATRQKRSSPADVFADFSEMARN